MARDRARTLLYVHLPTVLIAGAIAVGLLISSEAVEQSLHFFASLPGLGWLRELGTGGREVSSSDKWMHFALFAALTFFVHRSARRLRRVTLPLLSSASLCFGYSVVLELMQGVLGTRSAEWVDGVANGLGIGGAAVVIAVFGRRQGAFEPEVPPAPEEV